MRFEDFAAAHGLIIRHVEYGRWVRVPTKDHLHKKNGAYKHMGDAAFIQNHATMPEPVRWRPENNDEIKIDHAAMAKKRAEAARELQADRVVAENKANAIIAASKHERHAYLDSHNMRDRIGLVYYPNDDTNLLVIPMAVNGRVCGCQLIDRNGNKKFIKGQRTSGAEHIIGSSGIDVWVEGFCTGIAVHIALQAIKIQAKVHVSFSAGNLKNMACRGVVVADNDKSKTGEVAASETGLPFYLPENEGDDFCDEWSRIGTFKAGMRLREFFRKMAIRA